jgi:hypothetical protein
LTDSVHKATQPAGARARSAPRRVIRVLALSGLVFVLLAVTLVLFTESEVFRSWARDQIIRAADSSLTARLTIGRIEGNIFSGWELRDIALVADAGPIARIRSLVLRYNLWSLPWKRIEIDELTINEASITVTRGAAGGWNIDHLVRDTTASPKSGQAFDWRIVLRNVRLVDARIVVWDSTTQSGATRERFDTQHLDLDNILLAMSADIQPGERHVAINDFRFRNKAGPVSLTSLSADLTSTRQRTAVELLSVRTQNSGILVSASVDGADALSDTAFADLALRRFTAEVTALAVDTRELQYFLPSLSFLGGEPSFSLRASGSMRELTIGSLGLQVEGSEITFRGKLLDIDKGAEMFIDVTSENTVIVGSDIPKIVPGLGLPDYAAIGTARFRLLRFRGTPLDFVSEIDMESDAGAVKGLATMDMTGRDIVYEYNLASTGLNLAKVLNQPMLQSSLNVRLALRGKNFGLGTAVAVGTVTIDSSRFQRYEADSLRASLSIVPDSLHVDLRAALGKSRLSAEGGMRFRADSVTGFTLAAAARALDLSKALDRDDLASDLTFSFDASGNGFSLSDASADARIVFAPSRFGAYSFDADTVVVSLDQRNRNKRELSVSTQYADARVRGEFDIPRFLRDVSVQTDSLASGLRRFQVGKDAAVSQTDGTPPRSRVPGKAAISRRSRAASRAATSADTASYMNAAYTVQIKHTEPLARHFGARMLLVLGSLSGTVRGGRNGMDIDGNLRLTDVYYVDTSRAVIAAGVRLDYSVLRLRQTDPFRDLALDLRFAAQECEVGGLHAGNLGLRVSYADGVPRMRLQGSVDSMLSIIIEGFARKDGDSYAVAFPVFHIEHLGKLWENRDTVRLRVDDSAATITALTLARNGTTLSLVGTRTFAGENNVRLSLEGLPLSQIDSILSEYDLALEDNSYSGVASLEVTVSGKDNAPRAAAELYIRDLGYRQLTFEEFRVEARYEPDKLEVYSELRPTPVDGKRKTVFFASGSMPVHLALAGDSAVQLLGEANLRLRMVSFPIALVEKFVRVFSPLTGYADADITVQGTTANPRYAGFLTVENARGRFILNNMSYILGLKVEPSANTIAIRELTVRNDPADWREGLLTARGGLAMDGFRIKEFLLDVEGRLKVLRPESRFAVKALYGDLRIATTSKPVQYRADEKGSRLTGSITVEDGNLTYASENQGRGPNEYANIRYLDVNDTLKVTQTSLSKATRTRMGALRDRILAGEGRDSTAPPQRSIFDALRYEISVSTDGALRITMPFSSLAQEELNARLNIDALNISNALGSGTFSGDVTLGPESYYDTFGKRFIASGSLTFIHDAQNPDLKLKAVYSDYHVDKVTNERRRVYVIITILGTRLHPELSWDMRYDSPEGQQRPRAGDVKSNAFSFVLLGLFTDELSSSDRGRIIGQTDAIGKAVASSIVSGAATEFIAKAGMQSILRRVEFGGLGTQDARVKVTSELGLFLFTYDGKINNLSSSDISFEIPMSMFFPNIGFGNMVIQASRRTSNSTLETGTSAQESSILELKLLYRFSF